MFAGPVTSGHRDINRLAGGELAVFAAAIEAGTVQAGAGALQLTQSVVTERIHGLERWS
jgi:Bacterial regulatory helix-turn-helix protein, lysR family